MSNVTLSTINFLKASDPAQNIIFALNTGNITYVGGEEVVIEGARYKDGSIAFDKAFSNILEALIEGLNVG
jgi:hypothetical protein